MKIVVGLSTIVIRFGVSNHEKVVNMALLKLGVVQTAPLSSSDLDSDDDNICPDDSVDLRPVLDLMPDAEATSPIGG